MADEPRNYSADDWLNVADVAEIFEVDEGVIRGLIKSGELAAWSPPGQRTKWRINLPEVERLIAEAGNQPRLLNRYRNVRGREWGPEKGERRQGDRRKAHD